MDSAEIYPRLQHVFDEVFDEEIELQPGTTAKDVEGWDSLAHIRLLMTVEREFGIKFSTLEINGLATVGDLVALIQTHKAP
jgi:acyl carrier protein